MSVGAGKTQKRKLILHFDVNKTILMKDTSKSLTTIDSTISQLIANSAWGHIIKNEQSGQDDWVLLSETLSEIKPSSLPEEAMTYRAYIDLILPLKKKTEIHDDTERKKANQEHELQRNVKFQAFLQEGNPGEKLKKHFDKIIQEISIPQNVLDGGLSQLLNHVEQAHEEHDEDGEESAHQGLSQDEKKLKEIFSGGKYHIIPTFFKTLQYLKKTQRDYAVVFRTFGTDLDQIIWEFNKYCNGEHPCYNGKNGTSLIKFDGQKGTKDLRIVDKHQTGLFYRQGWEISNSSLLTGSLQRAPKGHHYENYHQSSLQDGSIRLYKSPEDQYVALIDQLKKKSCMAIQDDYDYWHSTDFARSGGKVLLIDSQDKNTLHIFFDDNAGEDNDCVIDVKDIRNMRSIPYSEYINKYAFKVEPIRAILEADYFVRMIEKAEIAHDQDIKKMDLGYQEVNISEEKDCCAPNDSESEWDRLQKAPESEYLLKTILPVLYQGMQVVDMMRPNDPLEFLSTYLLQNQDKIKLPRKNDPKKQ